MRKISKEDVIELHEELIDEVGGTHGIRDEFLLDSALEAPFQSFAGVDFYPSIPEKAARLCFGLVQNHAFVDGNKRIGTHVMVMFLRLNGYRFNASNEEVADFVLKVSKGLADTYEITRWILKNIE